MRCPICRSNLLQRVGDKLKVRVPILVFSSDGTGCKTSCPKCGNEISLPITLSKSALADQGPHLVVARGLTRPRTTP